MEKKTILEPSTNTHVMEGNVSEVKELGNGTMKLKVEGEGIVTHGEHGTIKTEKPNVIKYVQQEYNPITQKLHAAYD